MAVLLAAGPAWAAEAEPDASADGSASSPAKPASDEKPDPSDDVFIPTEDISEDFAVAFPVDI